MAQEKDSKNKVAANELTVLSLDQVFSRTLASGAPSYLLTDALGSTTALADNTGVISTSYTYEPFGKTAVAGSSTTNPFAFTGRENDSTGSLYLYNYRARSYLPLLQRFLKDPIAFAGGDMNLYGYVGNGPTYRTDATGLRGRPGGGGRKDIDYSVQQSCGIYGKFTIGVGFFAVHIYRDDCGYHFGGSFQASLLPASGSLSVGNSPISCTSVNVDAYGGTPFGGPGGEVGVGETHGNPSDYGEVGIGTPNVSFGLSGVYHCPNG